MASRFSFAGKTISAPGVLAVVNADALTPVPASVVNTVVCVGTGEGGKPKTLEWFSTPSDMAARTRGGDLFDVIPFVWAPSPDRIGPQRVGIVRVNPAVQATTTLKNSATDIITVTAANYGLRDNGISVKVEAGTNANSKKLTVADGVNTYVKDNITRPLFTLTYAGTTMAVTVNATQVATTVTGGSGASQTATFAAYPTVKRMVDFFAAQTGYTCVIDPSVNPDMLIADAMDYLSAVSALSQTLYANNMAIVDWLNSGAQPLVTATKIASVGLLVDNQGPKYLTSGSEGSTTNTDWQTALAALDLEDIGFIAYLSSNATQQGYLLTHVTTIGADGKRPRRAATGTPTGQASGDLGAAVADTFNSPLVQLASQGVYIYKNGVRTLLPPYFVGAMIAGLDAGVPIGEAITFKAVNLSGMELEWLPSDAQKNTAVDSGVVLIERIPGRGGFRIVRGISTWQSTDQYHLVEPSVGLVLDTVRKGSIAVAEDFLGKPVTSQLGYAILSAIETFLLRLVGQNQLVPFTDGKPWFANQATMQGDTILIKFTVQPVIPLNFVGITINAQPLSQTISVTVQ